MYVGTHADIDIQRAAMSYVPHFRSEIFVGAMSLLIRGLSLTDERSTSTSSEIPEGDIVFLSIVGSLYL
jgi:hypothetical protein